MPNVYKQIVAEAGNLLDRTLDALPHYKLVGAGIGVEELLRRDGQLPPRGNMDDDEDDEDDYDEDDEDDDEDDDDDDEDWDDDEDDEDD